MSFRERVEKYRADPNIHFANKNDQDGGFDSEYYGIENLRNPPACIDLRLTDGSRKALPYSFIMEIDFDRDKGITITTSTKQIEISGRNLARLYEYLTVFRVRYIQANVGTGIETDGIFIGGITITEI